VALVWIDSLSEMAGNTTIGRVYPAGGWQVGSSITSVTGRDGQANGAVQAGSLSNNGLTLTLPAPVAQLTCGFALKQTANGSSGHPALKADGGTVTHLALTLDNLMHLALYRGTVSTGTLLATSAAVWSDTVGFHFVEVKATIADSGGTCVVRVDGVEWINFTGDTRNAGTSTNIDAMTWASAGATVTQLDDLYVADGTGPAPYNGFLGDCTVRRLLPSGDSGTGWTTSTGSSHSALIKEIPANTTDYNFSSTVGQRDTYQLDDLVQAAADVHAVQVFATCTKTDAGARSVRIITRSATPTDVMTGALAPPTPAYAHLATVLQLLDPDGNPWTLARVTSLRAGVETA
jgi:hypothetical protein